MQYWTPRHVRRVLGGSWLSAPEESGRFINGVNIDSRTVQSGQAFIAIKGDRHDGHSYLSQAASAGASILIVSDAEQSASAADLGVPVLLVEDTSSALSLLARAWRQLLFRFGVKVIAVTGSNGKTTTRNLIHTALSARFQGSQSPKSFNNHIGVPLTLLAANPTDDFVVCEIGTNHPGEVAELCDLVRPDLAVVTSVGAEHMEFFGSIENVAREEVSVAGFVSPSGSVFLPCDKQLSVVKECVAPRVEIQRVRRPGKFNPTATGSTFEIEGCSFDLPLHGKHNAGNAALAVAVASACGIDTQVAATALANAAPVDGRLTPVVLPGDVLVINDAYNANPTSMVAALDVLCALPTRAQVARRVAVLGDMLELGEQADEYHRQIGQDLARRNGSGADLVVTTGPLSRGIADVLGGASDWHGSVHHVDAADELAQRVAALLQPGDVVLLKASRGMQLEQVIPAIERRFAAVTESEAA